MSEIAKSTTDHEKIRRWVDERGGRPAMVEGSAERNGFGSLRIDFPGYAGEEPLEPITWQEFFWTFDRSNLAFLYQEEPNNSPEELSEDDETEFSSRVTRDLSKEKSSLN